LSPSSVQTLRLRLASEESESDLVIQLTDTVTTAPDIIHMATTDRIRTTATILGRHTTGPTDTAITVITGITTIGINVM